MRKDKEFIFRLRREGKSYRDIQSATGVSRGTLCRWFEGQDWSKHITTRHSTQSVERSKDRMIKMNMVRKLKLQYKYALVEKEAEKEYEAYKNETLFWAGLMLYAGEGDKRTRNLIRISNSEFYIHRIFIQFCQKYLEIKGENLRCALVLYHDNNETQCRELWSKELNIPQNQFHKSQVIKGREAIKRLQFGTGATIISSTVLKVKILKWISLSQGEKFDS